MSPPDHRYDPAFQLPTDQILTQSSLHSSNPEIIPSEIYGTGMNASYTSIKDSYVLQAQFPRPTQPRASRHSLSGPGIRYAKRDEGAEDYQRSMTTRYLFARTSYSPIDLTWVLNDSSTNPPLIKCEWKGCVYPGAFSRETCLWRHIRSTHLSPQEFKCPQCNKTFGLGRKDKLNAHVRLVHSHS